MKKITTSASNKKERDFSKEIVKYDCEICAFLISFTLEQDKHVEFERHELYPEFFKCPDCGGCLKKTIDGQPF